MFFLVAPAEALEESLVLSPGRDVRVDCATDSVVQLAQAALAAPFAGFGDFEAYPQTTHKAGIYCSRIIRYHPLPDGNKRTGYDVMREFLEAQRP